MRNTKINLPKQRELIRRRGDWVVHYLGMKCPCSTNGDANRAQVSCPACGGTGWLYREPMEIRGVIVGIQGQKDLAETGIARPGDCVFIPDLTARQPGDYDLIKFTWAQGEPWEGELIRRGAGATDELYYEAAEILACVTVDVATGATASYKPDLDFTIDGRSITWLAGRPQPAAGNLYSVKYNAFFEWVCFVPPGIRFERGDYLGERVLLRRRHLVFPREVA